MEILVLPLIAAYFLPTIIAACRKHHQSGAIFILNAVLFCMFVASAFGGAFAVLAAFSVIFIGWVVALVWSCTAINPILQAQSYPPKPTPLPIPKPAPIVDSTLRSESAMSKAAMAAAFGKYDR